VTASTTGDGSETARAPSDQASGAAAAHGRIAVTASRISDTEVAAITAALVAAMSGAPAAEPPAGAPAWRRAGLLEALSDRRVRSRWDLRHTG